MRFAAGNGAVLAVFFGLIGGYFIYTAWLFAFRYQEELLKPVSGRQAAYQHLFLADHGHVGVVLCGLFGLGLCAAAMSAIWRAWTALPAAILGPSQLWLHPSFGKQPIPYANIVGVRLDYVSNKKEIALIVDLEDPAGRSWALWTWLFSRYQVVIRERVVEVSLFGLARFRDRLAKSAEAARAALQPPSNRAP